MDPFRGVYSPRLFGQMRKAVEAGGKDYRLYSGDGFMMPYDTYPGTIFFRYVFQKQGIPVQSDAFISEDELSTWALVRIYETPSLSQGLLDTIESRTNDFNERITSDLDIEEFGSENPFNLGEIDLDDEIVPITNCQVGFSQLERDRLCVYGINSPLVHLIAYIASVEAYIISYNQALESAKSLRISEDGLAAHVEKFVQHKQPYLMGISMDEFHDKHDILPVTIVPTVPAKYFCTELGNRRPSDRDTRGAFFNIN